MDRYDFVIAGGGIVGLTLARELLLRDRSLRVLLLEKEPEVGRHASGRNSGVLHTGVYYATDSLKARFCAEGNRALKAYASERGIRVAPTGKVIVAQTEAHREALLSLRERASRNGVVAELVGEKGLAELEPKARSCGPALFLPETASIDSKAVLRTVAEEIRGLGGDLRLGAGVDSVDDREGVVRAAGLNFAYGHLVNAAGTFADRLAHLCGVGEEFAIVPFKGLYCKLRPERAWMVRGHIYPTPDLNLPFLGVHLSRTVDGTVLVGPTATPALSREHYGLLGGIRLSEALPILGRLAGLWWANGSNFRALAVSESAKYLPARFLRDVRRLCPEVRGEDLVPRAKVGIRAQLVNLRTRRLEMDFVLRQGERSTHILNAISPAFTSSFPLAAHLADAILGKEGGGLPRGRPPEAP